MNIYEIDQAIMALVDPETGEIMNWDAFDQLQMERDVKIENVACWYKNLIAEADAIRQEEINLSKRRKTLETMADTRKRYFEEALAGQKFQTAKCSITFRKTTKVEAANPSSVIDWAMQNDHLECLKLREPELSKTEIGKLLKEGVEIPGAELVEGLSMGVK